jgi:hypothetical protein
LVRALTRREEIGGIKHELTENLRFAITGGVGADSWEGELIFLSESDHFGLPGWPNIPAFLLLDSSMVWEPYRFRVWRSRGSLRERGQVAKGRIELIPGFKPATMRTTTSDRVSLSLS